jgi:bacterioferritin
VPATTDSISFQLNSFSHHRSMMSSVVNMADASHSWERDPESGGCRDWREEVISTLKDSLIFELVCVVRYNHLSENSSAGPLIRAEFLLHAYEELAHAHKLAQRIAQLGGELEYSPNVLTGFGMATNQNHQDMQSMIEANLASERKAISKYTRIIAQIDEEDASTRCLLEEIVKDEREHAEELKEWLVN